MRVCRDSGHRSAGSGRARPRALVSGGHTASRCAYARTACGARALCDNNVLRRQRPSVNKHRPSAGLSRAECAPAQFKQRVTAGCLRNNRTVPRCRLGVNSCQKGCRLCRGAREGRAETSDLFANLSHSPKVKSPVLFQEYLH